MPRMIASIYSFGIFDFEAGAPTGTEALLLPDLPVAENELPSYLPEDLAA